MIKIDPEFGESCIRILAEIFGKPRLDQRTKAFIAVAVDVVEQIMGIPFCNHVKIALRQGVTPGELKDLLMLTTIYAGLNEASGFYGDLKNVLESSKTNA